MWRSFMTLFSRWLSLAQDSAVFAELGLKLRHLDAAWADTSFGGERGSGTNCLTHGETRRHHSRSAGCLGRRRQTASGHQQSLDLQRDQRPVRNLVNVGCRDVRSQAAAGAVHRMNVNGVPASAILITWQLAARRSARSAAVTRRAANATIFPSSAARIV